jgi:hypothetical protein
MEAASVKDLFLDFGRDRMGLIFSGSGAFFEPLWALAKKPPKPLIPALSAHVVIAAELTHREFTLKAFAHKFNAFVHGTGFLPRHGFNPPAMVLTESVTHVPGLFCNPCDRSVPESG